MAHDKFSAGGFVFLQVHGDQPVDHVAFAFANDAHIDGTRRGGAAELTADIHQMIDLGAPDFVLAGEAIDVGTRTADPAAFDDRGFLTRGSEMPSEELSPFTASDNQIGIGFWTHGTPKIL